MGKQILISKDGTKIAYERLGNGPVLIMVLGALNTRKTGLKLAKMLSSDFTVITYDRRGRGDSSDTKPYSPKREIEDLEAIMNTTGDAVFLYGHSSGGAIVLDAAIELEKKVKKLAVYEVPFTLTGDQAKRAKEYNSKLKKLIASGNEDDSVALFLQFIGVTDKQIEAMKHLPMWRGLKAMAPTLAYDSDDLGAGHALPKARLAHLSKPTLIMDGGSSPEFMRKTAEAVSHAIPKAQYRTLDKQNHGVKPDSIAPILVEFFKK